ncbi:trifunctional purine biosynthetic protein adenosine-3 isoform X4 [Gopherus flavomarginatus]|uniref:trifunctional purine biosynthetic protein adenosine-3 isoform X4 n=1 Tax=Gopherus flavomarginatus TaxID=286002 RepID=UPI0021CBFDA8|nr:trifunctional purine biosynthetic protein adenosine-3 isoform X4 [Gopherus flavomarginatus]
MHTYRLVMLVVYKCYTVLFFGFKQVGKYLLFKKLMADQVLVIGGGGREHALAWKLAQSPHIKRVLVAPGNAGTANNGKISNSAISISNHAALAQFCKDNEIKLVVVGPEVPLAAGIVDDLTGAGVRCFGPTARAAQLESSKSFCKAFLDRHGIPTARWKAFTNPEEACSFITSVDFPALVVKASGLAAGKGVIVATNKEGACKAVHEIMQVSKDLLLKIRDTILQKTVDGMKEEGVPYIGVLYAGLMLTSDGPKILEFNCRFGDPECQVILPLLKSDLYEVIQATINRKLSSSMPVWSEDSAAMTVVMASEGYPGNYAKGLEITGFSKAKELGLEVFHAGTAVKDGKVVTNGGRVLTVTAVKKDLMSALEEANKGVAAIHFKGAIYRQDIGYRAIAFLSNSRGLTYKNSGVDIAAGNTLVQKIKPLAAATSRPGCNAELGGFAGVFDLKAAGYKDPILVSGTDGVGTKLKIAQICKKHDTIGQDLVAMCVNDILAQGAEPLFFLDYFACGKLDTEVAQAVIASIAEACKKAGCALLGGETAEMPGMYLPGEYDLAGFAVGAVERGQMLPQLERVADGDVVIGIASSGVHSNGFSLVRKIVEKSSLDFTSPSVVGGSGDQTLGEILLAPTKIYSKTLLPVLRSGRVKAYAHITGGGLLENIPRVLPESFGVVLDAHSWRIPEIFSWLQKEGNLSEEEMARTFNCGIGAVLVVEKALAQQVLKDVQRHEEAWLIGKVVSRQTESAHVEVNNLLQALQANRLQFLHNHIQGKTQTSKVKVAVLISGTGTNLEALITSTKKPTSYAQIVLVISNKSGVEGLRRAERADIPTKVIDHKSYGSRTEFDNAVDKVLEEFSVELICLAGFMRILSGPFVKKWDGKILNIHPSLLPSFKGANAHKLVLQAGVRISGCTVHFVAEEVDAGAIIFQEAVPVKIGDTEETLSERVKEAEHRAFPAALELVASKAACLGENGKILWNLVQRN